MIKDTWRTPVDNRFKVIQKQNRNDAKFAFPQCSANSNSSKRRLNEVNRNVLNVVSKSVSTEVLNRLNDLFL